MIKSMTGFGRCELSEGNSKIIVEMKSVNHRYLDLSIKMPRKFNLFEQKIRSFLKDYVQRGKVDIYITYENTVEGNYALRYNRALASQYMEQLTAIAEQFQLDNNLTAKELSRYPEVLTMEEQELDDEVYSQLEGAVREAAKQCLEARTKEGTELRKNLLEKLQNMSALVDDIEKRSPELMEEYRRNLEEKVSELLENAGMDPSRLLAEVTIYADKTSVDEEIVRLKSHIKSTIHTLEEGGSVGRKLDFIVQEMNREANTILSKANDKMVSDCGIDLKTEIEKVREQIQNIE